jgi:hypothetical protein
VVASRTRRDIGSAKRRLADRKSRLRIDEVTVAQRKWQKKVQEPNERDLVTKPQELVDLDATPRRKIRRIVAAYTVFPG